MKNKFNLRIIIYIIISSIIVGFVYNNFTSDGIPIIREKIKTQSLSDNNSDNSGGIILITLSQTLKFYNQKKAVFIDARDQWEYSENHIKGAINIPEFSFSPDDSKLKDIEITDDIVIYCDGTDCDTSKRLASELTKIGYTNCFVFIGGISAWIEADLPIEKGYINE